MTSASLILENVRSDLKSGDGRIAFAVQGLIAFFLLSLTLASASIQSYLNDNLDQMLGADVVLESFVPLSTVQMEELARHTESLSRTATMQVVLTHGEQWERAQLKIVDDAYPVQGEVTVSRVLGGATDRATHPQPGAIWLGPRLAGVLRARVGETITFGDTALRVDAILEHEPDRLMEGHSVAMRAMVHERTFDSASAGMQGERFRYLIGASEAQESAIRDWQRSELSAARLLSKRGGDHPLASFWQRVENLFGLLSVTFVILGAVALDMTNRRWLEAMQYRLALYQSFGVTLRCGIAMMLAQWAIGFLCACLVAAVLAAVGQLALLDILDDTFPGIAPVWPVAALAQTVGLLALLAILLQLPFILPLMRASVSSLIRSEGRLTPATLRLVSGAAAVSAVALAYTDNWLLTVMILAAVAAGIVLLVLVTWSALWLGDRLFGRRGGLLPFVVFLMRRRITSKTAQVVGLGASALLLLVTLMLLGQIGERLEEQRRTHDGNLVIAEASEAHVAALNEWARETGSEIRSLRPFVRAQLVRVNDRPLADHAGGPSETLATMQEPIRLHWTDPLPANNRVVAGSWWDAGTASWDRISVEEEVMTDLRLELGDALDFSVDGEMRRFTLVSSHVYQPGASSITFWFQVPETARPHIPGTTLFMGTMELPETAWDALPGLWVQHPELILEPIQEITERFDRIVALVKRVSVGFSAFVLLLTMLVIAASVRGFEADDRLRDGLLQTMGFDRRDVARLSLSEWSLTGALAAFGAIGGAWLAGTLIFESQFGLPFRFSPLWVAGTLAAIALMLFIFMALAGSFSRRGSIQELLQGQ
ncbi:FtsX-like permease family protein [Parasphingopyxis sp.]|uniref:ABC transporter permease n=1 Tax=Parasphingopyxis sp. TaxID=1920299 RepID=UPI002639D816|nr:FtsX-like permease family protein [Parasphingopyxis sp.]